MRRDFSNVSVNSRVIRDRANDENENDEETVCEERRSVRTERTLLYCLEFPRHC